MKYEALFLDFYGTVVHEDDDVISEIVREICAASAHSPEPGEVAGYWWTAFRSLFEASYLDTFQTQRRLESLSLDAALHHFDCALRTDHLDARLFAHWAQPGIFPEAKAFIHKCPIPICVVSNIDRADIEAAIHYHGLSFSALVTSEDARSYKPRDEIFRLALKTMGLEAPEVLHVGDSLSSDVAGAHGCGIDVFWLSRKAEPLPTGVSPTYCGESLLDILEILSMTG